MWDTPASLEVVSHLRDKPPFTKKQKIHTPLLLGTPAGKLRQLRGLCVSAVTRRPVWKTKCNDNDTKKEKKKKIGVKWKISCESRDFVQPPRSLCDSNAVFFFFDNVEDSICAAINHRPLTDDAHVCYRCQRGEARCLRLFDISRLVQMGRSCKWSRWGVCVCVCVLMVGEQDEAREEDFFFFLHKWSFFFLNSAHFLQNEKWINKWRNQQ